MRESTCPPRAWEIAGASLIPVERLLDRVRIDPNVCHGVPCVRGTRIPVYLVVQYLANGDSVDDVLEAHPSLTREDVQGCLAYAAELARERILPIDVS